MAPDLVPREPVSDEVLARRERVTVLLGEVGDRLEGVRGNRKTTLVVLGCALGLYLGARLARGAAERRRQKA